LAEELAERECFKEAVAGNGQPMRPFRVWKIIWLKDATITADKGAWADQQSKEWPIEKEDTGPLDTARAELHARAPELVRRERAHHEADGINEAAYIYSVDHWLHWARE
jgi:hypothetical protein